MRGLQKVHIMLYFYASKYWRSMKQTLTTTSIMEAEFVYCFETTSHGVWLKSLIVGLRIIESLHRAPLGPFTGHLSVPSQPRTIFGFIHQQITVILENSSKPENISPGIKTKHQPSPGLPRTSPKNFQYSVPKSWD